MNARTSQGAIAWAISLVTFPWVALVLYAIFGRNTFNGYVLLHSSKNLNIQHYIEDIQTEASAKELIRENLSESEIALTRLVEMPITRFNKSRLLIDGPDTFRSIFEGIESAERYILIQFSFDEVWNWAANRIPQLNWEMHGAAGGNEDMLLKSRC
ncbi:MAG: PLDc N-terminal domain-containing protein [Desulfobacterales bacterium]|nr:MAG: PLDc N-terminal domain-containing protein [Desulfobacterales bacterium]